MPHDHSAIAVTLAGYDAASATGIARFSGDLNVIGPLDLRLGLTYMSNVEPDDNQFQPQVGVRVRLLSQEAFGIDLATAVLYRRDRYTQDEGLIQVVLAIGRRWGRFGALGNAAYGQDPEGDDRDGELALSLMYEAAVPLQLGLESHLRLDLLSDDPRRRVREQGPFDLQAGPIVHYSFGHAIVTVQTGFSSYRFEHTRTGLFALGGIGGVY